MEKEPSASAVRRLKEKMATFMPNPEVDQTIALAGVTYGQPGDMLREEAETAALLKQMTDEDILIPKMGQADWDAMRLSVSLAAAQLDKLTHDIGKTIEVATLVDTIVKREQAILRDMKKLAKLCGVDLDN